MKPRPESHDATPPPRRFKALRDTSHAAIALALKVSFQFCNESVRSGPLWRRCMGPARSVQDD